MLFPVNIFAPRRPKKRGSSLITLHSERSLETQRASIDDERQLQGAINVPQGEGFLGSMYPRPQFSEIQSREFVPAVVDRHSFPNTASHIGTSEQSSRKRSLKGTV